MSQELIFTCDRCSKKITDSFVYHLNLESFVLTIAKYDLCQECKDDFEKFMKKEI